MKTCLSDDKKQAFKCSLELVKKFPSSIPCVRFAQINAWNYAQIYDPLKVAIAWNEELPKQVRVNEDAFVDKGINPSFLSSEEKKEVATCLGLELDPMKQGFDPFYEWRFPEVIPSPIAEARMEKIRKEQEEWKKKKYHDPYGYNQGRYMGD